MFYFAYGSDLNRESILDWSSAHGLFVPKAVSVQPAILPNHRLAFPVYDSFWQGGVADAVPATGKSVRGALLEVSDAMLSVLDKIAGRSCNRQKRETGLRQRALVSVEPYSGAKPIQAVTYGLRRPEYEHVPPTPLYLQRMIDAAWHLGLSNNWIMHVQSFSTQQACVGPVPVISARAMPANELIVNHIPIPTTRTRLNRKLTAA